jgi:hypothetical protein
MKMTKVRALRQGDKKCSDFLLSSDLFIVSEPKPEYSVNELKEVILAQWEQIDS